jgi:hypothetical protein
LAPQVHAEKLIIKHLNLCKPCALFASRCFLAGLNVPRLPAVFVAGSFRQLEYYDKVKPILKTSD